MKKKHILFLHSSSEMYGSDRSLLYLLKSLDKNKYRITVILPFDGPLVNELRKMEEITVIIYEIAVLRRKNMSVVGMLNYIKCFCSSCNYIRKLIKEKHVDVVYTNVAVIFSGAVSATFSKNCKSVWHIREIVNNKMERIIISFVVNHFSDVIIANSKATGEAICKNFSKLKIVYNAVEQKKNSVVHIDKENVVIGMAGRINRWKGQKLFVDMVEIVHAQCPKARFKIAGAAYVGEEYMEEDIKKYIAHKNLTDVIDLLGQVRDMDGFYNSLDIFVLPSIQPEPFGLVVIEAMEKKLPVIATNHGGPVEIIDHGETGYLVSYENPKDMAEKCVKLCNDWNLREIMGAKAQRKKRDFFSLENTVKSIDEILMSI